MNGEIQSQTLEQDKCMRIKSCIDSFLENSRMTLSNVEIKTGIPVTTLRRIMNLKGNPQVETVFKICHSLGYDKELENYLKTHHPEIASARAVSSLNENYKYLEDDEVAYFFEESSFLIMNMANTSYGVTQDEINRVLGIMGGTKLNELVKKGLIIQTDDGRYIGRQKDGYKHSFKNTLKSIEMSLKYYNLEEAGNNNNFLSYQTESINDEGVVELKKL